MSLPRSVWALLFLVNVAMLQAVAFVGQFASGFVPFVHPPSRVPFSWDMFAVEIERCDIEWTPALPIGDGVSTLSGTAIGIEWFPVFDRVDAYRRFATHYCQAAQEPTNVRLHCVTPEGPVEEQFSCPP
jgi:hypothetical protein